MTSFISQTIYIFSILKANVTNITRMIHSARHTVLPVAIIIIDPRGRPQSRPVVITIFTHVVPRPSVCPSVRPSVRPAQNFKIQRQSLPAGTVGWPSGSLMTPVLFIFYSRDVCFVLQDFEKWRWMDNTCENNYHFRPGLWVGQVDQCFIIFCRFLKEV